MLDIFRTNVTSEIGELEGVILHTPGIEIENMTPINAEKALYSDILNRSIALDEYSQLKGVLDKVTKTYQVKDLLYQSIADEKVKTDLINKICKNENVYELKDYLLNLPNKQLAKELIEGVPLSRDTYTSYLSEERFALRPLHNFFFTRDASMSVCDKVLIGKMANTVREREALIMEQIFKCHEKIETKVVNPINSPNFTADINIEGGDFLVAREDIVLIGNGGRTTSQGIDFCIDFMKESNKKKHIIVQELPDTPESFIHLDMVFTLLDVDKCMVYEPLITQQNKYRTTHITIENGEVTSIKEEKNILEALKQLGIDLKPISCGGNEDQWIQQREQWHSGANFFAMGPGKVIGYGRNIHTINEMSKNGFEVISAIDVIEGKKDLKDYDKYVVTIDGSELSRGGGGCRCMTMPIRRKEVKWN